ncbi:translation initiation factor eIF 4e-like domain-containing protein [Zychaea mexicana]|uniref:translation initiation factor eIF 4e-like domain-containing protein n=1 Tax=Zychaea mexicana TaxID=64656 RepID=UPI0022FDDA67|nr:translation initiation factor eIF 4e-like domain-containing protein [Zychaea mexicana]KAI9490717.1 translation initiation factor eIF 4e-like domain-containing protein [Zychaea mexicana]
MADVETRHTATVTAETESKPVATPSTTDATSTAAADSTTATTTTAAESNDKKEEPVTTVFHDPINYNVKHPLHNAWTLWFDNPGKKANTQSWSQNLKEIVTVETVEDFWGVYNNIAKVNHLESNSNYHFFKKGVRPEWEDPANANGGKFSIQFPRNRTGEGINDYWLSLLLAMIGEQFAHENEVCGAVISVRKVFFRVALWIRSSERNEITEKLGAQIKEFLTVPPNMTIEFTPHGESAAKSSQKFTV